MSVLQNVVRERRFNISGFVFAKQSTSFYVQFSNSVSKSLTLFSLQKTVIFNEQVIIEDD